MIERRHDVSEITVINPFEVPAGRADDALVLWDEAAALLSAKDGFVDARLHRAVDAGARFAYVALRSQAW